MLPYTKKTPPTLEFSMGNLRTLEIVEDENRLLSMKHVCAKTYEKIQEAIRDQSRTVRQDLVIYVTPAGDIYGIPQRQSSRSDKRYHLGTVKPLTRYVNRESRQRMSEVDVRMKTGLWGLTTQVSEYQLSLAPRKKEDRCEERTG